MTYTQTMGGGHGGQSTCSDDVPWGSILGLSSRETKQQTKNQTAHKLQVPVVGPSTEF